MRVLCLIPSMGPGGAERAMSRLVSFLCERHTVCLLDWSSQSDSSFYEIPEKVQYCRADLLGGANTFDRIRRIVKRFHAIRGEVNSFKPDVVLSFMDTMNMTAILSLFGSGIPLLISE